MLPGLPTLFTALAALAAVLGLILLVTRAARFTGLATRTPREAKGLLAVRDVMALDARRRLHLVRCDGRTVLLLTGGPQDVLVGWLPADEPQR